LDELLFLVGFLVLLDDLVLLGFLALLDDLVLLGFLALLDDLALLGFFVGLDDFCFCFAVIVLFLEDVFFLFFAFSLKIF
jgi:hypothetical protein